MTTVCTLLLLVPSYRLREELTIVKFELCSRLLSRLKTCWYVVGRNTSKKNQIERSDYVYIGALCRALHTSNILRLNM